MAERTSAERNWQAARQEEREARRETGEAFRGEGERLRGREGGYGGGYQPASYEPLSRSGYGGGWQPGGPSDYVEGGYYGRCERGGYGRPPGFRYQGTGYGASSGYSAELEGGEWAGGAGGEFRPPEFRPGSYGPRGREPGGPRSGPWRGVEIGGWAGERGSVGGVGGWRTEAPWEQDRDYGEEGGWGGGTGFHGGYGGSFAGPARGGGFTRWQGGEGSWRGAGAPGYPGAGWVRGPEGGWHVGRGAGGYSPEGGWFGDPARGGSYSQGMRPGWGVGPYEWEPGPWGGRGPRAWGEPGRGLTGGAYGEPWAVPGPFTGRGPEGYQRSGESIRDDVCERLTRHGHVDASRIRVRVDSNNEVVLEGTVPDRRTKRLAEDVAESVSGVSDVQNRLRVSERDERSASGMMRGDERDNRESREWEQTSSRVGANQTTATRTGRPERDAEKQKATPRAKA